MRRPRIIALVAAGAVVFLVVSALLARAFSVGGAEDSAITDLVTAEAHGDTAAVVSLIHGCSSDPACRQRAGYNASSLRRSGSVSIIQIQESSGFSLGPTLGTARVAWLVSSSPLPRVQCVRVRRSGNLLSGFKVQLLEVSPRIKSNRDCPAHF